jgi:hypothetical protein
MFSEGYEESVLYFMLLSRHLTAEMRDTTINVNQDSLNSGRKCSCCFQNMRKVNNHSGVNFCVSSLKLLILMEEIRRILYCETGG